MADIKCLHHNLTQVQQIWITNLFSNVNALLVAIYKIHVLVFITV